jgi:glycerol-3-phosphate dehydrogenase
LVSVVGGKFTTFRLMAEEAVDLAGAKLGSQRVCHTTETRIDPPEAKFHVLRQRLEMSEATPRPEMVCECELVTWAAVEAAFEKSGSLVLNDLRRDLRLGMGPCQAGFCAVRAAGIMQERQAALENIETAGGDLEAINSALLEFLQERWKGLRPVMWGASLRQMELDLNIHRNLLGVDRLAVARPPEVYPTEKTA